MNTFRLTCEACPTQAEGRTTDGRAFYFRHRSGYWTLSVSEPGGTVWDAAENEVDGINVAEGQCENGWMDEGDVRAIVGEHLDVA